MRAEPTSPASVRPWLLGHGALLDEARDRCEAAGMDPLIFEVLDAESRGFFSLLNACNQVAFGGLGMPAWVQLDCCTLPGLMVGFGGPGSAIPPNTREAVAKHDPEAERAQFWPYSEFCGITRGASELVGVSNFSLVPRQGLGMRAKALGLWLSQASAQIGMTQWDNPATALHCKFGPLQVLRARTENHSRPESTFVYRLALPPASQLLAMLQGTFSAENRPAPAHKTLAVNDELGAKVQAMIEQGQELSIVAWTPKEVQLQLQLQVRA